MRNPRTVATTIVRIIFLSLPVLDFLHNDKSNSIYADSPDILLFAVGWN
jgi:hypothetical protein